MISLESGNKLVKFARNAVESYFDSKKIDIENFSDKKGCFVTIHTFPSKELRGCIGFIEPIFSLKECVFRAARAAAFSDPRFFPLKKEELGKVIFEVSILTEPEIVKNIKEIKIGDDGLIIEYENYRGLLLPQVFREYKCNTQKALEMTCNKSGLNKDKWKDKNCKIYKFQTEIFCEEKPNGRITRG